MLHNSDKKMDVVAEESKQIKEPEAQVSCQPKIEKVKQAPGQREQDASLKKSIIITGKLIFKAKQAHLPKLSVEEATTSSPTLLAWCSSRTNTIDIVDLNTKQNYASFDGVKVSDTEPGFKFFCS